MQRDESAIQGLLVCHWNAVITTLQKLNASAVVRPSDGWSIFKQADGGSENVAGFDFGPVCFKIPERASRPAQMDLLVVAEGALRLRRDLYREQKLVVTDSFETRVAYFRCKGDRAEHVYGTHYDFALDKLGHPIFHAQIRSLARMWPGVKERFKLPCDADDCVKGMLEGVRVPTAQMDVFSVCLQLFADHLLFKGSDDGQKKAFNNLISRSIAIQGAGFQAPRLGKEAAYTCFRAPHWYPTLA